VPPLTSVDKDKEVQVKSEHARETKVQLLMGDRVDIVVCDAKVLCGRRGGKSGRCGESVVEGAECGKDWRRRWRCGRHPMEQNRGDTKIQRALEGVRCEETAD
jgi:hypothetical protein